MSLPERIDFSHEIIAEATSAQVERALAGELRGDYLLTDGLVAAGVDIDDVPRIAAEISTTPDVRDRLSQAPFATGYVVGAAVVAETTIPILEEVG